MCLGALENALWQRGTCVSASAREQTGNASIEAPSSPALQAAVLCMKHLPDVRCKVALDLAHFANSKALQHTIFPGANLLALFQSVQPSKLIRRGLVVQGVRSLYVRMGPPDNVSSCVFTWVCGYSSYVCIHIHKYLYIPMYVCMEAKTYVHTSTHTYTYMCGRIIYINTYKFDASQECIRCSLGDVVSFEILACACGENGCIFRYACTGCGGIFVVCAAVFLVWKILTLCILCSSSQTGSQAWLAQPLKPTTIAHIAWATAKLCNTYFLFWFLGCGGIWKQLTWISGKTSTLKKPYFLSFKLMIIKSIYNNIQLAQSAS